MTSLELSFCLLGITALWAAYYGMKRYRTPLNPLTIFAVIHIGLFTIVSAVLAIKMAPNMANDPFDFVITISISAVYMGGFMLPYLFRGDLLSKLFGKVVSLGGLSSGATIVRFSFIKFILLLAGASGAFAAMAILGGGRMLWFTNAREAYYYYRTGAGPFWVSTQWFLMLAMLYYIWTTKPRRLKLLLILLFFCFTISFLGSKNNILTILVVGMVYYNFYIKRIPFLILFAIGITMCLFFLTLLLIHGSYFSLLDATCYFQDYFYTTVQFISRIDEFGFRYGQGWLSSLWFYVPRGLYSDKPYEYGYTLIHQVLFPGTAAFGHTPGLLVWSLAYLDFGIPGVLIYGVAIGLWQRAAYEFFLKHRQNFFAFSFALQFSIWPIWTFATVLLVFSWTFFQSIFFRLTWRNREQLLLNT